MTESPKPRVSETQCSWCGDKIPPDVARVNSPTDDGGYTVDHEWCFGLRVSKQLDDARAELAAMRPVVEAARDITALCEDVRDMRMAGVTNDDPQKARVLDALDAAIVKLGKAYDTYERGQK
jgi:hypothetical protein